MKIKSIKIDKFKRFTDLFITNIPESARLIVLVGPNGCGKTSVFEALNYFYRYKGFGNTGSKDYYDKNNSTSINHNWFQNKVEIQFHNREIPTGEEIHGKFYFRTAYRNEPDFTVSTLNRQLDPTKQLKFETLMQNDITVSENYQRLISNTLSGVFVQSNNTKTVEELREELIGKIKISLDNVFGNLNISSLGDPLLNGSFYFEKGISKDFHYKNLSAGEKSVFDLLLDMLIKSIYYPDAIFCIDEPEAHMHTRLQAKVLKELYNQIPINSQLWITTHSIGMLKQAEEIENSNPGSVVFLDFDNRDFDSSEIITPSIINKTIWDKFFDLAFADFSQLIAPNRIVFCEGNSEGRINKNFDAQIYSKIFSNKYHDTMFISIGSSSEIQNIENKSIKIVANILKSSVIVKFVDRDDKSDEEVGELLSNGIKTAKRRHLESYLLDDSVIIKLCNELGKSELAEQCLEAKNVAIKASIERGNPFDDIKSASGQIILELKKILTLTQCGNNSSAFLRDTIAPVITEDTLVYKELESEIF